MKRFVTAFVICAMSAASLGAQTISTVISFTGSDGQHPQGALVEGLDGNLYGITYGSLAGYGGSIFKLTTTGTLTTLYTFCSLGPPCTNGASPEAGLFLAHSTAPRQVAVPTIPVVLRVVERFSRLPGVES